MSDNAPRVRSTRAALGERSDEREPATDGNARAPQIDGRYQQTVTGSPRDRDRAQAIRNVARRQRQLVLHQRRAGFPLERRSARNDFTIARQRL